MIWLWTALLILALILAWFGGSAWLLCRDAHHADVD